MATSPSRDSSPARPEKPDRATRPHRPSESPSPASRTNSKAVPARASSPVTARLSPASGSRPSPVFSASSAMKARRSSSASSGTARGPPSVPPPAAVSVPVPSGSASPAIRPRKPGRRSAPRRSRTAATAWSATVRPKRASHAPGTGSSFSIVPVASPSAMTAPVAFFSTSVKVSSPSSTASSRMATDTVFAVSPAAKASVPFALR